MDKIYVIGGANIDIQGKSCNTIIPKDSNIGLVSYSFGGVARNIAENLCRLGASVSFSTVFGNDGFAKELKEDCTRLGMDLSLSKDSTKYHSSTYLAILDEKNDLFVGINDMDILNEFDNKLIDDILEKTNENDLLFIDTNLTKETIEYAFKHAKSKIAVDPISTTKVKKLKGLLSYITFFKPNYLEAEELSGIKIVDEKSIYDNLVYFQKQGVKETIITMGEKGSYLLIDSKLHHYQPDNVKMVSATGAGDAFFATYVYARFRKESIYEAVYEGSIASKLAIESENTVSTQLSLENIKKIKKEFHITEEEKCI